MRGICKSLLFSPWYNRLNKWQQEQSIPNHQKRDQQRMTKLICCFHSAQNCWEPKMSNLAKQRFWEEAKTQFLRKFGDSNFSPQRKTGL